MVGSISFTELVISTFEELAYPKVTKLHFFMVSYKNILRLYISMNNAIQVHYTKIRNPT